MGNGRLPILFVDLSNGTTWTQQLDQKLHDLFLGGKGLGAALLLELLPEKCDPFDSRNPIIFATGPLTGTLAPGTRACLVAKSPLTNTFCDSYFGGGFGAEIRYAGYDGIVLTGASDEPVYVIVEDGRVEIRLAKHLWGLDTYQTYEAIKCEEGLQDAKISCIGPAGENLVRYALVDCDFHRQAGRGGLGALWGSKKLKAVVVRGARGIESYNIELLARASKKALEEIQRSADCKGLTVTGSLSALTYANALGLLPTLNFQDGVCKDLVDLSPEAHWQRLWIRNIACPGCPIACTKAMSIRRGKWRGTRGDNVEYESAALLGPNLGIHDAETVSYLSHLCDRLGLDTVSTGGVIGFALEGLERGLIEPAAFGQAVPQFGEAYGIERLIHAIVAREGIGDVLANGVHQAAYLMGSGLEDLAVHVGGMECPAWGPRGSAGMGLAYITSDRGGCHQRAFPISYEQGTSWPGGGISLDPTSIEGKAEVVVWEQNLLAGLYSLVACFYATTGVSLSTYLQLVEGAIGVQMDEKEFLSIGERIWTVTRSINLREGGVLENSTLPPRFGKPLPSGPYRGHFFSDADINEMLGSYYQLRGWNSYGIPEESTIATLGLSGIIRANR